MQTKSLVQSASFRCLLACGFYRIKFSSKGTILHVLSPSYVGISVPNIQGIWSNGVTVTIMCGTAQASYWLSVQNSHVSLL